ncbi:hypothetical protein PIB30_093177 [Stylosanthes scabra]|uniref:Uncharacterized protein n=1 Tax=Stylosanthes scabra TaxID=79078 RepID=A0ABU6SVT6_9FABA|nr:hypothetical protein [Stylosanthes scabra]
MAAVASFDISRRVVNPPCVAAFFFIFSIGLLSQSHRDPSFRCYKKPSYTTPFGHLVNAEASEVLASLGH